MGNKAFEEFFFHIKRYIIDKIRTKTRRKVGFTGKHFSLSQSVILRVSNNQWLKTMTYITYLCLEIFR